MPWLVFAVEDASAVLLDAECQRILRGLTYARRYRTIVSLGRGRRLRGHRRAMLAVLAALVLVAALWAPLPVAAAVCVVVIIAMAAGSTGWLDLFMRERRGRQR